MDTKEIDRIYQFKPMKVQEIFEDYSRRRKALLIAFTNESEELLKQCITENTIDLCMIGSSDEKSEVKPEALSLPLLPPEHIDAINTGRANMQDEEWLHLVALHTDLWLNELALNLAARSGIDEKDRTKLFQLIKKNPNLFEAVRVAQAKKQYEEETSTSPREKLFQLINELPNPLKQSKEKSSTSSSRRELKGNYELGKTEVFLRAGQIGVLDARRTEVLDTAARLLQGRWRTYKVHKEFVLIRAAAITLQAYCCHDRRRYAARRETLAAVSRRGFTPINQAAGGVHARKPVVRQVKDHSTVDVSEESVITKSKKPVITAAKMSRALRNMGDAMTAKVWGMVDFGLAFVIFSDHIIRSDSNFDLKPGSRSDQVEQKPLSKLDEAKPFVYTLLVVLQIIVCILRKPNPPSSFPRRQRTSNWVSCFGGVLSLICFISFGCRSYSPMVQLSTILSFTFLVLYFSYIGFQG